MRYNFTFRQIAITNFNRAAVELEQVGADHADLRGFNLLDPYQTLCKLPTIVAWLQQHKLTVDRTAFLHVSKHTHWDIHIDHGSHDVALNLPISGCTNASTHFYKFREEAISTLTKSRGTGLPYLEYYDPNPELVDVYYLTKPAVLNIKMPHSVSNSTDIDRVCLSLRFRQDESFDTWIDSML